MEIARHWRLRAQRYRLAGAECPACGQRMFPPRAVCPQCAGMPGELLAIPPGHRVNVVLTSAPVTANM